MAKSSIQVQSETLKRLNAYCGVFNMTKDEIINFFMDEFSDAFEKLALESTKKPVDVNDNDAN